MCGITGIMMPGGLSHLSGETLHRMTDSIAHRGPDADGFWIDAAAGIALGHRRLSILDLSSEGSQPMISYSGRFVIVFNGEIYNYQDIRMELEGSMSRSWRGHSDTEVMLSAVEEWGIEGALTRFVGMFSFALWDRQEHTLTIARDRLGEKPLYYGWCEDTFLFASELKALRVHPEFNAEINRDAIALFLQHGYIPAPYSIYRQIRKLLPGTYLTIHADKRDSSPIVYWSAYSAAKEGQDQPFLGSDIDAVDQLEVLLRQAVRQQMVADVPIGAFLSGGTDSSLIVALMQAQNNMPIRTFTIGFNEDGFNEAEQAKAVARHLGTDHTEMYVTPQQALDVIPRLPHLYDEPFSDSSQIPTFLVSQMTRQHVTVSLSGDAGDELFGGYSRYLLCDRLWRKIAWLPVGFRARAAWLLKSTPPALLDAGFSWLRPVWEQYGSSGKPSAKIKALSYVLPANSPERLYSSLLSHWKNPSSIVIGADDTFSDLIIENKSPPGGVLTEKLMFLDLINYLPDDILVKVDRAAMGVSLETRVPMLDHRVVEFALSLPATYKIRQGIPKWILRQVLYRHVPQNLLERPKMGFGVPIDTWLRGPLREWAEALLDNKRLCREGFFRPELIIEKWNEHLAGTANWGYQLWDILMFQAWLESVGGDV